MTATNNTGYEIQEYLEDKGWITLFNGYTSLEDAKAMMNMLPIYKKLRVYESLEGY